MTAKAEAIANANAHLNNAGLPTYDDMLAALAAFLAKHDNRDGLSDLWPKEAAHARDLIAKARGGADTMSAIHRCVVFIDLHDQDLLFRRATEEFTKSDREPPAGAWTVTQAVVECLTSGLAPADCGFDILSTEG